VLDPKLLRENPQIVRKDLQKRGEKEKLTLLNGFLKNDKAWRECLQKIEKLRRRRNLVTQEIAGLRAKQKDAKAKIAEAGKLPKQIKRLEAEAEKYREKARFCHMRLPNILDKSVPVGRDENDNVELRKWGKVPKHVHRAKNHLEVAEGLGLIDSDRAAKVAGTGFFYLKKELAMLDYAIMMFALDFLSEKGYVPVEPPFMMRRKPYEGVTDMNDFENVMYKIENDDLYLIATSEHPMASMFMDEILEKERLPIKLVGISPCFRREIGAHGKYTKGLFRMHHFNKVEQFIFCHPSESWRMHEELQRNSETLYKKLGLPYRVVNVCTGDIGSIAAKKYDTEIWMADGKYREIGSNSNCTDYQARRLNIRFREKEGAPPAGFVHTLNNTALATSRTMIAILEVYQQKDGSVKIPRALQPYMGNKKSIKK